MISASQCRCARTLLRWSVSKLSSAPSVSESAIDDFELERRQPSAITTHAIRRAFEDAGVVFLPQDDTRSKGSPRAGATLRSSAVATRNSWRLRRDMPFRRFITARHESQRAV
jgi:transcriptional regulator with XRE-family HTH domain